MTDDIRISVPTTDDWDELHRCLSAAFLNDPDEASAPVERGLYEPERCLVARRGEEIVGTAGIYTRSLAVPGAVLPAGHVTMVSVDATARRQGILRRFMKQQFADMRAAGEAVAVLWASEGRIYQRFGYGLAVRRLALKAQNRELRLTTEAPAGRLRSAEPAAVRDDLVKVYDRAFAQRPGWSERGPRHWDHRLADPPSWRDGAASLRAVVHHGADGVDGYALFRTKSNWDDSGPTGEVRVLEHVAATREAYTALWQFLLTMDLTRTTNAWTCAVDEPVQYMVDEPRRLNARLIDALWLRIVDLPAALAARRYAADVDVVLAVSDSEIAENAGAWRLVGSPDSARCDPTTDEPDLSCDIRALGSVYLGGTALVSLAAAGLVTEHRPGALARAAAAFGWHTPPSVLEVF